MHRLRQSHFRIFCSALAGAVVVACSSNSDRPASTQSAIPELPSQNYVQSSELGGRVNYGAYDSSVWVSGDINNPNDPKRFQGSVNRYFGGDWLVVELDQQTKHGMDTGIESKFTLPNVSSLSENAIAGGKLTLENVEKAGNWWYGPKISVGWNNEGTKDGTDGWYENYIIDAGAESPQQIHDLLTGDWYKGKLVATTTQDGSVYKHYLAPFNSWYQFWSIRQDYRMEGTTNIGKIVRVWLDHGLPDKKFDGVKMNIETHHPQKMNFTISDVVFDFE